MSLAWLLVGLAIAAVGAVGPVSGVVGLIVDLPQFIKRVRRSRLVPRRFRARSSPTPGPRLTEGERLDLLREVRKRTWGQLPELIGELKRINVGLQPKIQLVTGHYSEPSETHNTQTSGREIASIFEASERRLLIVGRPGSGKTILAYEVARYLDTIHQNDTVNQPLPLVLNFTTWVSEESVEEWVIQQLCDPVSGLGFEDPVLARDLFGKDYFALIFDGLDEVPQSRRAGCLAALNDFLRSRPHKLIPPVVITCRRSEYDQLIAEPKTDRLTLLAAVQAQPLSRTDITANLKSLESYPEHRKWAQATRLLLQIESSHRDDALASPLMLSLAFETKIDPQVFETLPNADSIRTVLCAAKAETVLGSSEAPESTCTWMSSAAYALQVTSFDSKTFYLEHLTSDFAPAWLRPTIGILSGAFLGFTAGYLLLDDASDQTFAGWISVWIAGLLSLSKLRMRPVPRDLDSEEDNPLLASPDHLGPKWMRIISQIFFFPARLVPWTGGAVGQWAGGPADIVAQPTRYSYNLPTPKMVLKAVLVGCVLGLVLGLTNFVSPETYLPLNMNQFRPFESQIPIPLNGVPVGAFVALLVAFLSSTKLRPFDKLGTKPDLSTRLSKQTCIACIVQGGIAGTMLFGGIVFALSFNEPKFIQTSFAFGLFFGLYIGLLVALDNGGGYLLLQYRKRQQLRKTQILTQPPAEVINWTNSNDLTRPTGTGFQFKHQLLRDATAALITKEHKPIASNLIQK